MLETKQRANLAQMKTTLREMKSSNQKIFAGAHPACDENDWANGRWDMLWEDHLKECDQSQHLPKPNQNSMRSRQSLMVSANVKQNAPPSAKKGMIENMTCLNFSSTHRMIFQVSDLQHKNLLGHKHL